MAQSYINKTKNIYTNGNMNSNKKNIIKSNYQWDQNQISKSLKKKNKQKLHKKENFVVM